MNEPSIRVNGEAETLRAATIDALLREKGVAPDAPGIAVALNGRVVTRTLWGETALNAGDAIEIVHAKQGG